MSRSLLHTEASMGWGGQEMRILSEMQGLEARGWRVMLAADPQSGIFYHALKRNLPLIPLPFSYKQAWGVLKTLRQAIEEYDLSLIHTHSSIDAWLGGIAGRSKGKPVIRTRHLSTPIRGGLNAKLLYDKLADAVICTSEVACQEVKRHVGTQKPVTCIATGVDPSLLERAKLETAQTRKELGLEEGDIAIGTACILRSWKGLEEFLGASALLSHRASIKFFIFGAGSGLAHYQKLAQEKYPQANVRFMGHLDPIARYLSALDIFCLLSTANEGISQASLQAAFLEKPLVTTSVGGLPEVCLHEKTGLIVPIKDALAVERALNKLIDSSSLRKQLGQEAHQLVQERFTMDRSLDEIERVMQTVLPFHKA